MTPKQIYDLPPIKTESDLYSFSEFMGIDHYDFGDLDKSILEQIEKRFKVQYYANHSYDGERCWTLFSVWFDYEYPITRVFEPLMICQKAGRGGRDHTESYITDLNIFKKAKEIINSFLFNK